VDWVLDAIAKHRDAKMLVLQMEIPLEVIKATIDQAHVQGIPIVLNPSPFKSLPKEILQKVHTLIVNEVEAKQILQSMGDYAEYFRGQEDASDKGTTSSYDNTTSSYDNTTSSYYSTTSKNVSLPFDRVKEKESPKDSVSEGDLESKPESYPESDPESKPEADIESDPKNFATLLANSGIPQVILTLGDQGVYFNEPDSTSFRHQPAKSVRVVDPTAAGDSFLGAYVAARSLGCSVYKSVSYGVHAGALAVTKSGAQPSIPTREELLNAGWSE